MVDIKNFDYLGPGSTTSEKWKDLDGVGSGFVAVDIETPTLDSYEILGIGFSPNGNESYYFPFNSPILPWHILRNPNIIKIFHNGHFDIDIIEQVMGFRPAPVYDSLIAAQLLGYPPALHTLAKILYNVDLVTIEQLIGKKGKDQLLMTDIPEEKVALKCCNDTKYTYKFWESLRGKLPWEAFLLEMDFMPIALDVEQRGMRVDVEKLLVHRERVEKEVKYYRMICQGMGFNPGSPKQVAAYLEGLGIPILYNKKTHNPKLDEKMLNRYYLDSPIAHIVLNYRHAVKLLSTYIDAILDKHIDGDRIYGRVHQISTNSGRPSTTKPNRQNIPPIMRDIFIPSEGCVWEEWDKSQIELRVLAYTIEMFTGDATMADIYRKDVDGITDFHQATADRLSGLIGRPISRPRGKTVNFAVVYLGDENTLLNNQRIPLVEGKQLVDAYYAAFPGFPRLVEQTRYLLQTQGYTETLGGRRRYFIEAMESGDEYRMSAALREGFNHRIQGTAAEDLKRLQVRAKAYPQNNMVHDSIMFDKPWGMELDRTLATNIAPYRTPITVNMGMNWGQLAEVGNWG